MESFGIFCLFTLLIGLLVGLYHLLLYTFKNDHTGNRVIAIIAIIAVDLYYLYSVFHHGLWMLLRNR